MKVRVGAESDIGRARERNEDAMLVDAPMYAVADGMGGHQAGDVASALALETLERLVPGGEVPLAEAVREANGAVFERSTSDRAVAGMGTTLTAVVVEGRRLRLAHVGDSRAYLFRDGALHLLTEDHTLVNRMVREGKLSEEEARVHPQRSILTRALGVEPDVSVDEGVVDANDGDRILLCTDGLTGMVGEEPIRTVLAEVRDPQRAAERLVAEANRAGGLDNITVVILDLGIEPGDEAEVRTTRTTATASEPAATHPGSAEAPAADRRPPEEEERVEFGPSSRAGRPRWVRLTIAVGLPLLFLASVLVGIKLFVDRQWYVGIHEGNVAVFRGIPTEIAGFDLHSLEEESDIDAAEAERLQFWRGRLAEGITVASREEAEQVLERIRADLAAAATEPGAGGGGTGS